MDDSAADIAGVQFERADARIVPRPVRLPKWGEQPECAKARSVGPRSSIEVPRGPSEKTTKQSGCAANFEGRLMAQRKAAPLVGLVMGSDSDWEIMRHAAAQLDAFSIPYEA